MSIPKHILVPTDFSEAGDAAIEYAIDLAQQLGAIVHLLHVVTLPVYGVAEIGMAHASAIAQKSMLVAQDSLDRLAERLRDRVEVAPVRLEMGDAREVIDRVAEDVHADLIVMGTHGRKGLSRWFMGSVAESVVRTAPCPVLTVHQHAAA